MCNATDFKKWKGQQGESREGGCMKECESRNNYCLKKVYT